MPLYWIWYALLPDAVPKRYLLQHFSSPEDIFHASPASLGELDGITPECAEVFAKKDLTEARNVLARCEEKNIRILTLGDAAYPKRLKNISDPPMVLYYRGRLPDFDSLPVISVVGTRKASAYGLTVAKRLGAAIAAGGGLVASGCASGIDAMAMDGALSTDSAVVGILGCGADVVYPKSNSWLYSAVLDRGCLITEYPPGTRPYRWNFPRRNRILSGIASGILVVEAPTVSGALNTARHALEQGRDVFVVPGNIDVPSCEGSNALLREGATAVRSGWDVLQEYEALYPGKLRQTDPAKAPRQAPLVVAQPTALPQNDTNTQAEKDIKSIDNRKKSHYSVLNASASALTEEELSILKQLGPDPRPVDEVIAETALPASTVLATLTRLSLKGLVRNHPGKRVSLQSSNH